MLLFFFNRVWIWAWGLRVWLGEENQDTQGRHAGGTIPSEEQRLQDVQDEADSCGEVHLWEQPRPLR